MYFYIYKISFKCYFVHRHFQKVASMYVYRNQNRKSSSNEYNTIENIVKALLKGSFRVFFCVCFFLFVFFPALTINVIFRFFPHESVYDYHFYSAILTFVRYITEHKKPRNCCGPILNLNDPIHLYWSLGRELNYFPFVKATHWVIITGVSLQNVSKHSIKTLLRETVLSFILFAQYFLFLTRRQLVIVFVRDQV